MLDEIQNVLENASFIKEFSEDERGNVSMIFDEEQLVYYMCALYRPIVVSKEIKEMVESCDDADEKKVLLLSVEKARNTTNFLVNHKVSFSEDEIELGLDRLDRYDLDQPAEREGDFWYLHSYTQQEKEILNVAVSKNLEKILAHAVVSRPNSFEVEAIEELFNLIHRGNISAEGVHLKGGAKKRDKVCNLVVNLICQGYLSFYGR